MTGHCLHKWISLLEYNFLKEIGSGAFSSQCSSNRAPIFFIFCNMVKAFSSGDFSTPSDSKLKLLFYFLLFAGKEVKDDHYPDDHDRPTDEKIFDFHHNGTPMIRLFDVCPK